MKKMFRTKIITKGLGKNGSWFFGGNATTTISDKRTGGIKMEMNHFGKTEEDAVKKLMDSLIDNDTEWIEVDKFINDYLTTHYEKDSRRIIGGSAL